jgi:2-polyprenyl-3-methyl-5-hydroxy-6-metoxy-1,4-benzoquinol methylase
MQERAKDHKHAEKLWKETFSQGIREDADHYELAKHLNAKTHEVVAEFVYAPAAELMPGRGTFLDAGCGSGFFCDEFARAGHDVVGIDFNADLIAIANRRYPALDLRRMDIYECGALARTFDLIVCAGVIQSVFEPERAFAQLASLQEPAGHLSVCTRNKSFLGNALTPVMTRVFQKFELPFNYYSMRRLRELGERAGYTVERERYLYMFPGFFSALNRFFNRSDLLNALCFPLAVHVIVTYAKRAAR